MNRDLAVDADATAILQIGHSLHHNSISQTEALFADDDRLVLEAGHDLDFLNRLTILEQTENTRPAVAGHDGLSWHDDAVLEDSRDDIDVGKGTGTKRHSCTRETGQHFHRQALSIHYRTDPLDRSFGEYWPITV